MSDLWTPAMDERLKQLRIDGLSYAEIGLTMGISRNAAIGRAGRLKAKGVEIAATVPPSHHIHREGKPKPAPRAPRVPPRPRPIRTREENTGKGVHLFIADPPRVPWRIVQSEVWSPLEGTSPVPLLERSSTGCAWPVGGQGVDLLSCNAPAEPGCSYCATHHRMGFVPLKRPARDLERMAVRAARC